MKNLSQLTIFELKEYRELVCWLRDKYANDFKCYNSDVPFDINITELKGWEVAHKFKFLQQELGEIDKLIENKIFENYEKN